MNHPRDGVMFLYALTPLPDWIAVDPAVRNCWARRPSSRSPTSPPNFAGPAKCATTADIPPIPQPRAFLLADTATGPPF
ncbi:hypothetical protein AB0F81_44195 [Actinoplanes sp. NPDC024001]|uniref:hypothetical protein n=1 Tax=Actinoplanes sp. NPDC024001 TaxID=3154598 RepID=UPI0033D4D52C